ncbi:hypothetical protein IAR50_001143 [Cryptococcus sp. DSM 104548]
MYTSPLLLLPPTHTRLSTTLLSIDPILDMCLPHLDPLASDNKCSLIPRPLVSNPRPLHPLHPLRPKRLGVQYAPRSLLSTYLQPKPSIYQLCNRGMSINEPRPERYLVSRTKSYGPLNKPGHDLMLDKGALPRRSLSLRSSYRHGHRDSRYSSCLGRPIAPGDTWPVEELLSASLLALRATVTPSPDRPASPAIRRERVFTPPPRIHLFSDEPLEREIFMQEIPGFATSQLEKEIGLAAPDYGSPYDVSDNPALEVEVVVNVSEDVGLEEVEILEDMQDFARSESESCGSGGSQRRGLKKSVTFNEETEVYWFEVSGGTGSEAPLCSSSGYETDIDDNLTPIQRRRGHSPSIIPATPPSLEHQEFWDVVASLGISPIQGPSDIRAQSITRDSQTAEHIPPRSELPTLHHAEDASLESVDDIIFRPPQDSFNISNPTPIPTENVSLYASSTHLSDSLDDTPTKVIATPRILSHTVRPPIKSPSPAHAQSKKNSRHPRRGRQLTLTPVLYTRSTRRG